jgi:hypothetical protein
MIENVLAKSTGLRFRYPFFSLSRFFAPRLYPFSKGSLLRNNPYPLNNFTSTGRSPGLGLLPA